MSKKKNWKNKYKADCILRLVRLYADLKARLHETKGGDFYIRYSIWNGKFRRRTEMNFKEIERIYDEMYVHPHAEATA